MTLAQIRKGHVLKILFYSLISRRTRQALDSEEKSKVHKFKWKKGIELQTEAKLVFPKGEGCQRSCTQTL